MQAVLCSLQGPPDPATQRKEARPPAREMRTRNRSPSFGSQSPSWRCWRSPSARSSSATGAAAPGARGGTDIDQPISGHGGHHMSGRRRSLGRVRTLRHPERRPRPPPERSRLSAARRATTPQTRQRCRPGPAARCGGGHPARGHQAVFAAEWHGEAHPHPGLLRRRPPAAPASPTARQRTCPRRSPLPRRPLCSWESAAAPRLPPGRTGASQEIESTRPGCNSVSLRSRRSPTSRHDRLRHRHPPGRGSLAAHPGPCVRRRPRAGPLLAKPAAEAPAVAHLATLPRAAAGPRTSPIAALLAAAERPVLVLGSVSTDALAPITAARSIRRVHRPAGRSLADDGPETRRRGHCTRSPPASAGRPRPARTWWRWQDPARLS